MWGVEGGGLKCQGKQDRWTNWPLSSIPPFVLQVLVDCFSGEVGGWGYRFGGVSAHTEVRAHMHTMCTRTAQLSADGWMQYPSHPCHTHSGARCPPQGAATNCVRPPPARTEQVLFREEAEAKLTELLGLPVRLDPAVLRSSKRVSTRRIMQRVLNNLKQLYVLAGGQQQAHAALRIIRLMRATKPDHAPDLRDEVRAATQALHWACI